MDIPPLVEYGNSVPLTITVDSPMSEQDFVKAIAVFNERNPQPNIGTFHLGPRSGRAFVSTRIRLGDSQTIVAVALVAIAWQAARSSSSSSPGLNSSCLHSRRSSGS